MSNVESLALALLVSQHTTDLKRSALQEELAKLQAENAKLKAEQRAKNPPKAKKGASGSPVLKGMLREPTVETSTEFLSASRKARTRDESIAAIAAFVGYDVAGHFGTQDTRARMLAQTTLRPVSTKGLTREEQRSASRTAAGFVAGLPDHQAKQLANLRAQVERVTDAMIACQKAGNAVGAAVEKERLHGASGLYAQIKALGFNY
jgi:hypothetical protein